MDPSRAEAGDAAADDEPPKLPPDGRKEPWWTRGTEPDYRATLANERTFLSWTRLALALLASSLAAFQLISGAPRALRVALAAVLILLSVMATVVGYVQWRIRQERMRMGLPLGHRPVQALVAITFVVLAGLVIVVVSVGSGGR